MRYLYCTLFRQCKRHHSESNAPPKQRYNDPPPATKTQQRQTNITIIVADPNVTESRNTTVSGVAPSIRRSNDTDYDKEDVNESIRRKKEKQDSKMGTDAIGSK